MNQNLLSSLIFGSLTPGLKTNDDGSVDVFVGPAAPGRLETNRVKSGPVKSGVPSAPHPNASSTEAGHCPTSRKWDDPALDRRVVGEGCVGRDEGVGKSRLRPPLGF